MNKLKTLVISGMSLVVLGVGATWLINAQEHEEEQAEAIKVQANGGGEYSQELFEEGIPAAVDEDDVVDPDFNAMGEENFMEVIHHMTHQKVDASPKWGAAPMTKDRIERMLEVVKAQGDRFANADFYEKTLTTWLDGDFSNAVQVHNTIWEMQDGTIGKATGLMSAEEEQEYIEDHFKE